jgi:hypothetical protein
LLSETGAFEGEQSDADEEQVNGESHRRSGFHRLL